MTREELKKLDLKLYGVYELREIARQVGVERPTTKKRESLEQEIKLILDGKAVPSCNPNKGRRTKRVQIPLPADVDEAVFMARKLVKLEKELKFVYEHIGKTLSEWC